MTKKVNDEDDSITVLTMSHAESNDDDYDDDNDDDDDDDDDDEHDYSGDNYCFHCHQCYIYCTYDSLPFVYL